MCTGSAWCLLAGAGRGDLGGQSRSFDSIEQALAESGHRAGGIALLASVASTAAPMRSPILVAGTGLATLLVASSATSSNITSDCDGCANDGGSRGCSSS